MTNFEPNYLPYIEFYDEDFPWRYTPAAPDLGLHRLRPWLALIVLEEDEFRDAAVVSSRPLPAFELTADVATSFPPAEQLWAWAHVHVNRDLIRQDGVINSADGDAAGARLEDTLAKNADHAYSRILSPRRLAPNLTYHAFLVPSFESGRLAGLGLDPARRTRRCSPRSRPGRLCRAARRRGFTRTTTAGPSAPARSAISSISSAC